MQRIVGSERTGSTRRGMAGQRRRRRCESAARTAAVAYLRWSQRRGHSIDRAAERLAVDPVTLGRWKKRWREDRLAPQATGRPAAQMAHALRAELFSVLDQFGGSIGVPSLCRLFPKAGKRELHELLRRYRHATRRDRRVKIKALSWTRPGTVWAIDFSEPPAPIDGIYDRIFCVRDLSSSNELWALPTIGEHEATVLHSLEALVRWHGAPLVLKLDNGGVFRSRKLERWAKRHGIQLLFSPPYIPEYNGCVESGMATLKVHAHIASARNNRPGEWTQDDIQLARMRMNDEGRPRGQRDATPDEIWNARGGLSIAERTRFGESYRQSYKEVCSERDVDPDVQWQHAQRTKLDRAALGRTLIELGLLTLRKRWITLPVSKSKPDNVS